MNQPQAGRRKVHPEIAKLDRFLANRGEDIRLRRLVGAGNQSVAEVKCRAFVRGYAPSQLIGGITQQDSYVILSPTQINKEQWPGGHPTTIKTDPRVPVKLDKAIIAGKVRNVEAAVGIYMNGELVRIEMRVLG